MNFCETCGEPHNGLFGSGRFCSDFCAKSFSSKNSRQKINEKVSQKLKGRINPALPEEVKDKISKTRNERGLNVLLDNRIKCLFCTNLTTGKKFCSNECRVKYSEINKSEKELYRKSCRFSFPLVNYPNEFDFHLITKFGWYKAPNHGNNQNGISRDHMYSISEGFKNKVDPYYISHPANCKLIRHEENLITKNFRCSITLEELENRVQNWNLKYGPLAQLV